MSDFEISRLGGRVKVKWTEDGREYGFIVKEKLYERLFHEKYAEYTTINDVTQHKPGKGWDSVPHPSEWEEFDLDADEMNEKLWEVDYQEEPVESEEWHEADDPHLHNKGEWHVDPNEVRHPNRRDNG